MLLDARGEKDVLLVDADSGLGLTTEDVLRRAGELAEMAAGATLAFLFAGSIMDHARDLLALLEAEIPVALLDPGMRADTRASLLSRYRPDLVIGERPPRVDGYSEVTPNSWRAESPGPLSHPDLAVLLTTSGSTGSPKLVQLSRANIRSNAEQIAISLEINESDRGVTLLPLFYSFGMSILTSHMVAGSSVLVTDRGLLDSQLWDDLKRYKVTLLPGVPQSFAMLKRLGFAERDLPAVRGLLQAGGRLPVELVDEFDELMKSRGGALYVMYGQTEASPRIACLPPQDLPEKRGSAGKALRGGRLVAMDDDSELPAGDIGEIVYSGPNVMMGYAQERADLILGDIQGDTLRTGDLGYVDQEGFLFLTGRTKRIAKLAGERVSLDEIEASISGLGAVAAVDAGDHGVTVFTTESNEALQSQTRRCLARHLRVAARLIRIEYVDELPILSNGKTDYQTLSTWIREAGQ